jgi:hypothetical protein
MHEILKMRIKTNSYTYSTAECLCGKGKETAEHVLFACDDQPQAIWGRGIRFERLVSEADSGALVARQLIRCGKLGQYSLAAHLLYPPAEG